jgi:hypothetical protein
LQLFNAALLPLCCHGDHTDQLGELLALQSPIGIQKGLRLRQRVAHQVTNAVTGADQAGDGGVPSDFVRERSVGASRWAAP